MCRSPLAEKILGAQLRAAIGTDPRVFRCESAGTWGHSGAGMEPHAAAVLAERGIEAGRFVARELNPDQVLEADLILGATREHREQVRLLDPYAGGRTFTIREFARFARRVYPATLPEADPAARARVLVDRVAMLRTPRPGPGRPADDIPDPFGAPLHVFRLCADMLAEGLAALVEHLAPASTAGRRGSSAV
ncbi:low molecular weight phosphatase family protein [Sporichthya brevicatena]|uniref:Low molecular weight phosphatase family protein n=1 Tax=Sporichthya brevicatena TaxID=171442 RepID=A0ABN1H8Q7_9ACTN